MWGTAFLIIVLIAILFWAYAMMSGDRSYQQRKLDMVRDKLEKLELTKAANAQAKKASATIIPTLRYQNAPAAIDWLCDAFGFEKHLVVTGENGVIEHAQLTLNGGMIMLGSARDAAFDQLQKIPADVGGVCTQSPYIVVDDVDAHFRKAAAAGAEIVMQPEDQDYGGRLYSCKDSEGHLWNFGSYNPWS